VCQSVLWLRLSVLVARRRDREHVLELRPRGLYGPSALLLRRQGRHPRLHEGGRQGADRAGVRGNAVAPGYAGTGTLEGAERRAVAARTRPGGSPSRRRSPAPSRSSPPTTPATSWAPALRASCATTCRRDTKAVYPIDGGTLSRSGANAVRAVRGAASLVPGAANRAVAPVDRATPRHAGRSVSCQ
jgi:hypothetical protein